jgi:DNA-binding FrmR family transcriptional regulator
MPLILNQQCSRLWSCWPPLQIRFGKNRSLMRKMTQVIHSYPQKPPRNGYWLYLKDQQALLAAQAENRIEQAPLQVVKQIAASWKALDAAARKVYKVRAKQGLEVYAARKEALKRVYPGNGFLIDWQVWTSHSPTRSDCSRSLQVLLVCKMRHFIHSNLHRICFLFQLPQCGPCRIILPLTTRNGYWLYAKDQRDLYAAKAENKIEKVPLEVVKEISANWKALDAAAQEVYKVRAKRGMEEYAAQKEAFVSKAFKKEQELGSAKCKLIKRLDVM